MREITCGDGTRWRLEAVAAPPSDDGTPATGADDEEVALLSCVTCEGTEKFVTIRAPNAEWRELHPDVLCRLIDEAAASAASSPDA